MKFIDLFAGIGGFRLGLEENGHECVGFCEIDDYARKSYKAIHDTEGEEEWHDITTVTNESVRKLKGEVDIICGGFPCQSFSIAGKRGGFGDTRGTLFFEIMRFSDIIRPRYLLLENVKGLLNHEDGNTFEAILRAMDECGYDVEWQVLNTKDFSTRKRPTPQNRERVFIVGHLRGERTRKILPVGKTTKPVKNDVNKKVEGFNTLKDGSSYAVTTRTHACYLPQHVEKKKATLIKGNIKKGYVEAYPNDGIRLDNPNGKTGRGRVQKQSCSTIMTGGENGVLTEDYRIRKLTPKECWRLQGFPDWAFHRAQKVNSDSQLYKQVGNSVTVNVIGAIAEKLE